MSAYVSKHRIVLFYVFAFVIAWSAWLLMPVVRPGPNPDNPPTLMLSTLGALGPLLSLWLLEKLSGRQVNVKQVLAQIKLRGAGRGWCALAILGLPAIFIAGNLAAYGLGWEKEWVLLKPGPAGLGLWALPVMAVHFAAALFTSPLFEEPGWRGFALASLQDRFGREAGSLIVGVLWWAWHQPMNLAFGITPTVYGFISMVALSFMIDSLFNLSGKNLLTAMLAHQSSGTVNMFLYEGHDNLVRLFLLIGFVMVLRLIEALRRPQPVPAVRVA